MDLKQYRALDWQEQDEAFFEWLDQYLEEQGLPSFEQAGDYGHVDVVALREQFETQLEAV